METINYRKAPHKLVLLVDDSSIDNFVNQKMIELNKFSEKVIAFTRAKKALDYLADVDKQKSYAHHLPSIIFLDLNMPIMDGHEFIKYFKALSGEIKNNCKIIVLTSSVNPIDFVNANDQDHVLTFLSKPLMKSNFDQIETIMDKRNKGYLHIPSRVIEGTQPIVPNFLG